MLDTAPVLPEAIYSSLRAEIIDQTRAPGTTVTESAVALQYGVARPTAKMAIERLVTEGLLRREMHQAARVPELTREDIVDLYDNRVVVECAAVASLAHAGAVPASAIAAHRALLASADAFAEQDVAFHRALVAGQPSPRLARMHELLLGEIELCIGQVQVGRLLDASAVADQHQSILDAVTAGDVELAIERTRDHIHTSRDRLLARVDSENEKNR